MQCERANAEKGMNAEMILKAWEAIVSLILCL